MKGSIENMKKIKNYILSKEFIITLLIIAFMVFINIKYPEQLGFALPKYKDGFAFWKSGLLGNFNDYLVVILPMLFAFCSTKKFFYELSGSALKDTILREDYHKYLKKNIFLTAIKAVIPLYIVSTILLTFGIVKYGVVLANCNGSITCLGMRGIITNPFLYVILTYLLWYLFALIYLNIVYIFFYIIKKYYVALLASYISFIVLDFALQAISAFISMAFDNGRMRFIYDLIYGLTPNENILSCLFIIGSFLIISFIVVKMIYKDKEKVVINFEG